MKYSSLARLSRDEGKNKSTFAMVAKFGRDEDLNLSRSVARNISDGR
jgi:hypothetical protein